MMKVTSFQKTATIWRETGGLGRRHANDKRTEIGTHVGKFRGAEFQIFLKDTKILTTSIQFIFVLTSWTVSTRVTRRRVRSIFSLNF